MYTNLLWLCLYVDGMQQREQKKVQPAEKDTRGGKKKNESNFFIKLVNKL